MNNKISRNFPFIKNNKNLVYLDSAGTSLKPKIVIKAISDYYEKHSINNHSGGGNSLFNKVQTTIQQTREIIAQRINAKSEEIVFLPSTTYSLNILAISLKDYLKKGDKVCLTRFEHSSNFYPWQAITQEKEAKLELLDLNQDFIININNLSNFIDKKTKIVSFSHMSNSLGVINPVTEIVAKIKKINPICLIIIDACQSIAHLPINVKKWNIDALVFSGHKVYGPTGIGILWIKKKLGKIIPDIFWGGGKRIGPNEKTNENLSLNQKFEVGTLPLAQIFGLKKSFEFLNSLDIKKTEKQKKNLRNYLIRELIKLEKVIIYNQKVESINIILFNLKNYHSHDVVEYLAKNGICARAGNFCCPYLNELIETESSIRISLSIYNTKKDINKLINCLKNLIKNPELIISWC